jgi:membrane protein YqaA with SNARE-associated domain
MTDLAVYTGLFLVAFLAATIFPAQSEVVLTGLLLGGDYTPWILVLVASVGNILGAVFNWGLGRGIERFHDKKWYPLKGGALERTKGWYQRYGRWSLLLSWVPIIGDPLTVAAGVMGESLVVFLVFVTVAKTGRYLVLTVAALNLAG